MNETKRRFRSPLNFGVDYLQSRPPLSAAYQRVSLIVAFAGIVFGGIAVVGVVALTWQRTGDAETRINDNQHNAVISCQNANESRKASLALWTFLFDTSLKSNPDMPAQQRRNIRDIRVWIAKLYAPRDCTDLSKKYEIPPPPVIRPIARSS